MNISQNHFTGFLSEAWALSIGKVMTVYPRLAGSNTGRINSAHWALGFPGMLPNQISPFQLIIAHLDISRLQAVFLLQD